MNEKGCCCDGDFCCDGEMNKLQYNTTQTLYNTTETTTQSGSSSNATTQSINDTNTTQSHTATNTIQSSNATNTIQYNEVQRGSNTKQPSKNESSEQKATSEEVQAMMHQQIAKMYSYMSLSRPVWPQSTPESTGLFGCCAATQSPQSPVRPTHKQLANNIANISRSLTETRSKTGILHVMIPVKTSIPRFC